MTTSGAGRSRLAPLAYAVVDVAVVIAPALVLALDASSGGAEWHHGSDLVVGSALVAIAHGGFAAHHLRRDQLTAARPLDVWIAALDALVVLALASTALVIAVLIGLAGLHTRLAARGWPVLALWIGLQVIAVAAAEGVRLAVLRWLRDEVEGTRLSRRRRRNPLPGRAARPRTQR